MFVVRSEEHTSELQSHLNLVCRLLLEKKKYHQRVWRLRRGDVLFWSAGRVVSVQTRVATRDTRAACALRARIAFLVNFFFFNDRATPEISPLSLHDALPI